MIQSNREQRRVNVITTVQIQRFVVRPTMEKNTVWIHLQKCQQVCYTSNRYVIPLTVPEYEVYDLFSQNIEIQLLLHVYEITSQLLSFKEKTFQVCQVFKS